MANQEAPPPIPDGLDGLGARLSLAILHLAISQSEFARRLGSSPGFVSDIVRGVKKPGAEFLAGIKQTFGISTDWLLMGEGTMFGGAGINLDLLRAIRLQVAVARAAVVDDNPTAKALLLLIRDGRLGEATGDPALRAFLDQLCASGDDFELVTELYNGHLWTTDPATQQRNLLAAAVAHFEARKPLDKIASLARASGATIQINIGTHQRNAGRDHRGR
jgi:transcriptional regulator with XRE-family HTH domain